MKNFKYFLGVMVLLCAVFAHGQASLSSTTLSSAANVSSTNVQVASASGITAGQTVLYVDREAMFVNAISGTLASVTRGSNGTRATAHISGATVYVGSPSQFVAFPKYGACTRGNEAVLPVIDVNSGIIYNCFGSTGRWQVNDNLNRYVFTLAPQAQPSGTSPTAGNAVSLVAQTGGAQSATSSNGAAGGAFTIAGGAGGAGGSASGTGGAGGALSFLGGAGGGTITGGAGGAAVFGAGAGANGSTAGGSGGALTLYSGAKGTGGTGTDGAVAFKQGGASGTNFLAVSTAGALTLSSTASSTDINLTPATSGVVVMPGGALTVGTAGTSAAAIGLKNATSGTITIAPPTGALGTVTNTMPAITGGVVAGFSCGATGVGNQTCSPTAVNGQMHMYNGSSTLSSNVATITFPVAFTSTSTFFCVANDITTRANPVQMVPASASTATITNTTGASDVVQWICAGQ